ncbi:MAG: methylated-DNA--[protein]-cysteine S-methyltransferase [Thermodesulfobacteriota bacterium]|nr:methylated-DNA--[protein]-cysteine S-methyltransferase [Thermodesulfobacteriota bacterium]
MDIYYTIIDAPPGPVYAAESKTGLFFVHLGPDSYNNLVAFAQKYYPEAQVVPSVIDAAPQIMEYVAGERRDFDLPLDLKGTDFQLQVWRALQGIPYGRTETYAQVAESVGRSGGAQAVGQANKANPIPIVIPCHRVVEKDGNLGGFAPGPEWKKWLLDLEKA